MRRRTIATWAVLAVCCCGCGGPAGPATYEVSGKVTWEGRPLEEGDIILVAADNAVAPAASKIVDGTYRLQSLPGRKRVSIRASRLVPGSKGAMGEPVFDNFIPEAYNDKTTLEAEIKTDQENRFDFALDKRPASHAK